MDVEQPFPRIPYTEAIRRFGTDHVDLRYGMELADLNDVFAQTSLGIFKSVIGSGGVIRGFAVPGAGNLNQLLQAAWASHVMPEFVSSLSLTAVDGDYELLWRNDAGLQAAMVTPELHPRTLTAFPTSSASG